MNLIKKRESGATRLNNNVKPQHLYEKYEFKKEKGP